MNQLDCVRFEEDEWINIQLPTSNYYNNETNCKIFCQLNPTANQWSVFKDSKCYCTDILKSGKNIVNV